MSKYNNKKVAIDGINFDSQKEAARYAVLRLLERGKAISDLRLQVAFVLAPAINLNGRKKPSLRYIADFVYMENGKQVIEDVKGMLTEVYKVKRHLMIVNGYEIREI